MVNQKHLDPMEEKKQLKKKFLDANAPRLKKGQLLNIEKDKLK